MPQLDPVQLVLRLAKIGAAQPWLEFKENLSDPEKIGRTISALANGAALSGRETAYLIWGIEDGTGNIIGTDFEITAAKKGNENLSNWLRSALSAGTGYDPVRCTIDGKNVLILIISRASGNPSMFQNVAYIRDGSCVKPLSKVPVLEQKLWKELQSYSIESSYLTDSLRPSEIEELLDCQSVLELLRYQTPGDRMSLMDILEDNGLVDRQDDGGYCVRVLGAILFAKDLTRFDTLSRKTLRLIKYEGTSKFTIEKEIECIRGYASGFEDMEKYLSLLLPSEEIIDGARRSTRFRYPPIAVRELVANALIHQDLSLQGINISVEIFSDRVIISSPGKMLIEADRVLNAAPVSRNEKMSHLMRRIGLCEELGSGWDRTVGSCEEYHIPAPTIRTDGDSTVVTILGKTTLKEMSPDERRWSCYMHACSMYARGLRMTNASLRDRFGSGGSASDSVTISRLIRETKDKGLIKPFDTETAPKNMSYIPYWA